MKLFNEKEQKIIENMCPSCKDLCVVLEKAYNKQRYNLTEKQIYNLNHACYNFECWQVGEIIKNINNQTITTIDKNIVEQLNKGTNCPALQLINRVGDCFEIVVKSFNFENKNEFNFEKFEKLGGYFGIEYINSNNPEEIIYKYLGDEEYLYYKVFIPYDGNYKFSYKTTSISSTIIHFFDEEKNIITVKINDIIKDGIYNEDLNGIIKESNEVEISYAEKINIAYFMVGFKVERGSYFSDLCLQKIK